MEKLSVNDILALLLPGLFSLFCVTIIGNTMPFCIGQPFTGGWNYFVENEFLNTSFFLLLAIVAGAIVQRINAFIINQKWYNPKEGLYKRTGLIFSDIRMLQHWLTFYNADCKKIFGYRYDGTDIPEEDETKKKNRTIDVQGDYFDYVFYAMMGQEKNAEARAQQNFYFFFRSLFTVSALAATAASAIALIGLIKSGWQSSKMVIAVSLLLALFAYLVCRPLGVWYRKRMVRVLFYQYYIEKNDKEFKP